MNNIELIETKYRAKPFIKWVGGKGQLLSSIKTALPIDMKDFSELTYIEPFVGGGAVLFWILQNFPNIKRAVINDINPDLIMAYKTVRDNPFELVKELRELQQKYYSIDTESKRKEFFLVQRELFNTKKLYPIKNTALFIFLNRTCFNGLYRVNSNGLFNVPFGKYSNPCICDEKTIFADSELLENVEILNGDFEQTFKYATKKTIFYFDPPYKPLNNTSSFTSYTKEDFSDNEQIRLKNFCDKLNLHGYLWLLSNSDLKSNDPFNNFFDSLYANYSVERVWASRAINANPEKRGKLTELLIRNYNNEKANSDLRFHERRTIVRTYK